MKLVVGLGNPGKKYEKTRHNIGFVVIDALAKTLEEPYNISRWELSKKFNAEVCGTTIKGEQILLVKPLTFMNDSGAAVQQIAHFYKLTHRDIIVVHDEKDLPLGTIKVQTDRGDAGHNGIKSIIAHIGTKDFTRVRVGVASDNKKKMEDTAVFVLKKFGLLERKKVEQMVNQTVKQLGQLLSI